MGNPLKESPGLQEMAFGRLVLLGGSYSQPANTPTDAPRLAFEVSVGSRIIESTHVLADENDAQLITLGHLFERRLYLPGGRPCEQYENMFRLCASHYMLCMWNVGSL